MNIAPLRLVEDDRARATFRVNRRVFTDPDILEMERGEVFDRSWLYVGHESEIAELGNYVTREVSGRPVILLRDVAGKVRAYLNSCPHRGNMLCRERSGSTRRFTCFYHAWSFDTAGKLVGIPEDEAYGPNFDRAKMGLTPVPRVESYRGLVFVSFDAGIMSLGDYLGNARPYIDLMFDYADEFEISKGFQSYSAKANWKLLVENSMDSYHAMSTHQRYFFQFTAHAGIDIAAFQELLRESADTAIDRGRALDNGHALIEMLQPPSLLSDDPTGELKALRARLVAKFGPERARLISDYQRNVFIFPNLLLLSLWNAIRTWYPVSPNSMAIETWAVVPRNEPQALRERRLQTFNSFHGPAGFGTPDDLAVLETCQAGFGMNPGRSWSDISRGMTREEPRSRDELQMRSFWRRWHAVMLGERGPTNTSDRLEHRVVAE